MPTFMFFQDGQPKGVAVDGLKPRPSVVIADGLVERIRGADKPALQSTVQALAGRATLKKE